MMRNKSVRPAEAVQDGDRKQALPCVGIREAPAGWKRAAWFGGKFAAFALTAGLALCATPGCSRAWYKESADREVYRILQQKRQAALKQDASFTIEPVQADPLEGLPRRYQPLLPEEESRARPPAGQQPAIINARKAIEIAIQNSREYQQRKEDVYLAALDLTLERRQWTPQFAALLSGQWQRADGEESWASDSQFGVTQLLATGATISLKLTTDLIRYATGDSRLGASSLISGTLSQPLWRGAWRRIAQENLSQAERNVVYALRSFDRYHRTFAVSVATAYYQLLQQRDVVRNEWNNYRRLTQARERAEMLAQAGRLPEFQVDQSRQDELRAKDRYVRAEQQYRQSLDQFKLELGLTTDANVEPDEADLRALVEAGLVHPEISAETAVKQALALRPDLLNALDQVDDAMRKVEVAANGLAPEVDLVLGASAGTTETRPAEFRFERGTYRAGIRLDPDLDRKAERNAYRRSLIALERARRNAAELTDNIKLQVRRAWRRLQEARESYEIQRNSLALAERRVESTSLLLQAGRASTRDLLDSQAALVEAQNALVRVLVDHTVARLELWRDMGTLAIASDGMLEEEKKDATTAVK